MKQAGVKLIVLESFYPSGLADIIASKTGARVLALPSDVGATASIKTYFDLIDSIVSLLTGGK
jgi:ABC-type Zn uptake system ZnuABC Zn-binding protein ZnuA